MDKKIIFCSGGTGGHIFPAISMMRYLSDKGYDVMIVTDERGSKYLKEYPNLKAYIINTDTPTKKNFFNKIISYFNIIFAIFKSILIIKKTKPNLIFGFGGYASFPVSFASKFFNIPLIIYDNNLILGRANKILAIIAKKILLAVKNSVNFSEKQNKKSFEVGYILRKDIVNYSIKKSNSDNTFTVLALGGSQGARVFGEIIPPVIKKIRDAGYEVEIKQQCLESQKKNIIDFYRDNKIKNEIFTFSEEILNLISSADLAISRCGASTAAELVHTLTPFIGIPLPSSTDNHQLLNAEYFKDKGCCWVLKEDDLNVNNLFNLVITIINDRKNLINVREKMKNLINKNVYTNVENIIKGLI